ncbi:putative calmodulin [Neospora caninum Liverpool]|uniref:Putative calmodulin n=1 Tax=Neospora caninum (strain Liverpool) TaxID=572307 RepID=F0VCR4_NEOCL|nr:putative calmodulin [Neospora caninum Liverpool]CBZ51429.1 putative calmodulin [Neospora caninum Liverpool]|eukprot:XP_003881462.1 putative calmodulin [Neospora caninum Liverpool]
MHPKNGSARAFACDPGGGMASPGAVVSEHRAWPGLRAPSASASAAVSSSSLPSSSRLASPSSPSHQPSMQQDRGASGGSPGAEAAERRRDIQRAFALFDRDGDGRLDRRELKAACRALGVTADDFMIDSLLRSAFVRTSPSGSAADSSSGSVDFDGFLELCVGAWPQRSTTEELREIFRLFDTEQKGYVTAADVMRAARAVGSSLSAEDVELMVREADRVGDGRLTFGDFERVFRRMRGVPGRPEGEALEVIVDDDEDDL